MQMFSSIKKKPVHTREGPNLFSVLPSVGSMTVEYGDWLFIWH